MDKPKKYTIVFYPGGDRLCKTYEDITDCYFSSNVCSFDYKGKRVNLSGSYTVEEQ